MKVRILKKRFNQYRTLEVYFVNFPLEIDIKRLEIESYSLENGQSRLKGISIFNFSTISLVSVSSKNYFHCVGWNGRRKSQIILKEKNIKHDPKQKKLVNRIDNTNDNRTGNFVFDSATYLSCFGNCRFIRPKFNNYFRFFRGFDFTWLFNKALFQQKKHLNF